MRRWSKRILIVLAIFVLPPTAYYFYATWQGERELREVMAELDANESPWRWADLLAARQAPAEEDDVRAVVLRARALIPSGLSLKKTVEKALDRPPQIAIGADDFPAFNEDMQAAADALAEARKLVPMTKGRFHLLYAAEVSSINFNEVQQAREFAFLLQCAAAWHAERGDLDAAMEDCLAMIHLGQSLRDEFGLIPHLVGLAIHHIALANLERVLNQGQATPAALARVQQTLESWDANGALKNAMRGERAFSHAIFEAVASGKASMQDYAWGRTSSQLERTVNDLYLRSTLKQSHAWTLKYWSRSIKALDLPAAERNARVRELDKEPHNAPGAAKYIMPAWMKVLEANRRSEARTGCAIAALACERFRRDNQNRWPKTLDELCPKWLAKVPDDPYASQPLQLRPTGDGIVVFSVGPDGKQTGTYQEDRNRPGSIPYEIRLWDVRRQAGPRQP